jgi:lipopolysaccharide export system protein LptA
MKTNLNLLATLALAAALSPAAFAQQRQSAQPGLNDPQTQNTPAPDASADTQTQNFSGTIVKAKNHYVLKTDRMTYQLDDETKAKQFEGKEVNVSGTVDKSTSVIHVTDIQPAS